MHTKPRNVLKRQVSRCRSPPRKSRKQVRARIVLKRYPPPGCAEKSRPRLRSAVEEIVLVWEKHICGERRVTGRALKSESTDHPYCLYQALRPALTTHGSPTRR